MVQRIGASRFAQRQIECHQRLAPVADLCVMFKKLTYTILILLLPIFCLAGNNRPHEVDYSRILDSEQIEPAKHGDIFDWQNKGPLDFIEILKQKENVPWHFIVNKGSPPCGGKAMGDCSFEAWVYGVFGFHKNWIVVEDIPKLIELLDSEIPCASVASSLSSYIPKYNSTVGQEAAFLIEGFRQGKYPPDLNSVGYFKPDKNEIRRWWQKYKKKTPKSYQEIEEKLKNILPEGWTIISNPNEFILSRAAKVKFYNCMSMYCGEKIEDRVKDGRMEKYKIKLVLSPLVNHATYNKIKSINDKIEVTKGTPIKDQEFYIANRGALQAYDSKYKELPNYYNSEYSIYCYTTRFPYLSIWPEEVAVECGGVIEKLGELFKKY